VGLANLGQKHKKITRDSLSRVNPATVIETLSEKAHSSVSL
jgi:hypothetical protein